MIEMLPKDGQSGENTSKFWFANLKIKSYLTLLQIYLDIKGNCN